MEIPILLAIGAGILFAVGNNIARIGVINEDPIIGTAFSIFSGTFFLAIITIMLNQINLLLEIDTNTIIILSLAGIFHFVLGRSILFYCSKIIGVSRTQMIMSSSIIYIVILGGVLLGEILSFQKLLAIGIMISGIMMVSISGPKQQYQEYEKKEGTKGVIIASIGAILVALSSILISIVTEIGSSYSRVLVSYIAASLMWSIIILSKRRFRESVRNYKATKLFMTHGIITALAQIGRYESISLGSVVIVHPITLSVNPIVTIILASIFLNKIEKINAKVWIAGLLVIIGIQMAT